MERDVREIFSKAVTCQTLMKERVQAAVTHTYCGSAAHTFEPHHHLEIRDDWTGNHSHEFKIQPRSHAATQPHSRVAVQLELEKFRRASELRLARRRVRSRSRRRRRRLVPQALIEDDLPELLEANVATLPAVGNREGRAGEGEGASSTGLQVSHVVLRSTAVSVFCATPAIERKTARSGFDVRSQ